MEKTKENKPIRTLSDGALILNIFENVLTNEKDNKEFKVYNINLSRLYTDEKGDKKFSGSFREADLLKIAELCKKAYEYVKTVKDTKF